MDKRSIKRIGINPLQLPQPSVGKNNLLASETFGLSPTCHGKKSWRAVSVRDDIHQ